MVAKTIHSRNFKHLTNYNDKTKGVSSAKKKKKRNIKLPRLFCTPECGLKMSSTKSIYKNSSGFLQIVPQNCLFFIPSLIGFDFKGIKSDKDKHVIAFSWIQMHTNIYLNLFFSSNLSEEKINKCVIALWLLNPSKLTDCWSNVERIPVWWCSDVFRKNDKPKPQQWQKHYILYNT